MVLSVLVVNPCDRVTDWGLWLSAGHHTGYRPHITSLGKDENSKVEVQFLLNAYSFCTIIKLKNPTFNHLTKNPNLNQVKDCLYNLPCARGSLAEW